MEGKVRRNEKFKLSGKADSFGFDRRASVQQGLEGLENLGDFLFLEDRGFDDVIEFVGEGGQPLRKKDVNLCLIYD